jgi:hypothetical protein
LQRIGRRISGDRTGESNSRDAGWEFVHVCMRKAFVIAADVNALAAAHEQLGSANDIFGRAAAMPDPCAMSIAWLP